MIYLNKGYSTKKGLNSCYVKRKNCSYKGDEKRMKKKAVKTGKNVKRKKTMCAFKTGKPPKRIST